MNLRIKNLMKAKIHEGHSVNDWDPATGSYLFAEKEGFYIIDLEQTIIMFRRALNLVEKLVSNRGNLLYIPFNLKKRKSLIVQSITSIPRMDYNYSRERWHKWDYKFKKKMFKMRLNTLQRKRGRFDGLEDHWDQTSFRLRTSSIRLFYLNKKVSSESKLNSNKHLEKTFADSIKLFDVKKFDTNYKRMEEIKFLDNKKEKKFFWKYKNDIFSLLLPKKKENLKKPSTKKIKRSPHLFWSREQTELRFVPEVIFISDVSSNFLLIKESVKLGIPIIGIINSNTNPHGIQYPIPGNNNSNESLHFYLRLLVKAIAKAKVNEVKKWNYSKKRLQVLRFIRVKRLKNRRMKIQKRKKALRRWKIRKNLLNRFKKKEKVRFFKNNYKWKPKKAFLRWKLRRAIRGKKKRKLPSLFLKKRRYRKKKFIRRKPFLKFKRRFLIKRSSSMLFKKLSFYHSLWKVKSKIDILKLKESKRKSYLVNRRLRKLRNRKFYFLRKIFRGLNKKNLSFFKSLEANLSSLEALKPNKIKKDTKFIVPKNLNKLVDKPKNSSTIMFSNYWFRSFKVRNKDQSQLLLNSTNFKNKKKNRKKNKKLKKRLFTNLFNNLLFSQIKGLSDFNSYNLSSSERIRIEKEIELMNKNEKNSAKKKKVKVLAKNQVNKITKKRVKKRSLNKKNVKSNFSNKTN